VLALLAAGMVFSVIVPIYLRRKWWPSAIESKVG